MVDVSLCSTMRDRGRTADLVQVYRVGIPLAIMWVKACGVEG